MNKEKTSNKDNDIGYRKMLYCVLLEEYERLEILSKAESEEIRKKKKQAKLDFNLKDEEELAKILDVEERERENRKQLELRGQYNAYLLKEMREVIHKKDNTDKPNAICLSGGGIRSATFNLGVLQGLARHGLLDKFDYLSTVSGGGYIGSWFSAWINRAGSVEKVQAALNKNKLFSIFFGLVDFKLLFDENEPGKLLVNLNKLKEKLKDEEEFFGIGVVGKLFEIVFPTDFDLIETPSNTYKFKEFTKELCRQLNQIILKEQNESPLLKKELSKAQDFERCRKKREIIEKKLVDFLYHAGETEKVLETDLERHDIEPEEITHLRTFSNYMSPRVGLFSSDTWSLLGVYLRNLLLNWTVFVPFIAAVLLFPKICAALITFEPNETVKWMVLIVSVLAGLIGVCNLNGMRPTLNKISWVEQNYEINDIGTVVSVESKILRWCVLPLNILAIGMTYYWFAINRQPLVFPTSFLQQTSPLIVKLIPFIVFSVILFVGGFLIARIIIWRVRNKRKLEEKWKHFFIELFVAMICGTIGGALLYVVVNNFSNFGEPIYIFRNLPNETVRIFQYVCLGAPLFLMVFLLTATVFVGIASRITDDMDREWMAKFGGWILMIAIAWMAISSVVLFGPELITLIQTHAGIWTKAIIAAIGGVSGLVTLVLGFSKKSESETDKEPKSKKSLLLWFAPQVAAPVFALFLIILIVYGTNAVMDFAGIKKFFSDLNFSESSASFFNILIWMAILSAIVWVMSRCININKFSLHATYRERLIRAYLGASRSRERLETANSFTGLDNADNVEMKELFHKPFHVVNMTLNLASSSNLRWQQRKAESFTASALHCGSSNMGGSGNYRSSVGYAYNSQNGKAITLGTAAAISGAAASPNMGYFTSSSAVSFLMALFNIRLGWWLGNTGKRGDKTYNLTAPKNSLKPFIDEAFGRTNDTNKYIYLTDGGHFDNLGLYEMVLRRCNLIIVCDAVCDANFEFFDFGSAIHKIRVDMGISIEFVKETAPMKGRNCGIATIKYSAVDGADAEDGTLIYIKPTLDGDESMDIINYKKANPDFPHESTADQMYSETQFESYRKLGFHMINSLCCQDKIAPCGRCTKLSDLKLNAEKYLQKHRPNENDFPNRRVLLRRLFVGNAGNK